VTTTVKVASESLTTNVSPVRMRANEVAKVLVQHGHIPLTRMLAPGAMGESHQIGNDTTAEGQEQNGRVMVRVLQNKGIAGA
jgi:outer membrane protein OmpA-like peptidoglycan-associated protein